MAVSAIIPSCNSNLCLMAALFKQSREDPMFVYEHVEQNVLEACLEPFKALLVCEHVY